MTVLKRTSRHHLIGPEQEGCVTEFQIATLAVQEAELEISCSAIWVGIGQVVAGVLYPW